MLKIKVINGAGNEMYIGQAAEKVSCIFNFEYEDGDWIIVDSDRKNGFYKIRLEDSMQESIVYVPGNFFTYFIPKKDKRTNYSPKSFYGNCHIISVEDATEEEVLARRNLAFNPYDQHENNTFFPHSSANIETRGECAFASRNAIDGYYWNDSHGSFPYQSWGINRDPKAEFKIDFGREVIVDEVVLTLRADFPHDNYWENVTLEFSDGSSLKADLVMTDKRQSIKFEPKKVTTITLKNLIKAKGVSEFPALTQFEAWGTESLK
jgi:hypothetical protein